MVGSFRSVRLGASALLLALAGLACPADTDGGGDAQACESFQDCDPGSVCVGGECRSVCNVDNDCVGGDQECVDGACMPVETAMCRSDGDCQLPPMCMRGPGTCTSGTCDYPPLPAGEGCSDVDACTSDDACDGNGTCVGIATVCVSPPDDECRDVNTTYRDYGDVGQCNPSSGDCEYSFVDTACSSCLTNCLAVCSTVQCPPDDGNCNAGGQCDPIATPPECVYLETAVDDTACFLPADTTAPTGLCKTGVCEQPQQGQPVGGPCGVDGDCLSDHCQNATCCMPGEICCSDHADCGACEKCSPSSACVRQDAGEDFKDECDADMGCGTGSCDGLGACDVVVADADCGTCRTCDGGGACITNSTDHGDCGPCEKCGAGTCTFQSASEDLKLECTVDAGCGSGDCDGNGGCDYAGSGADCGVCRTCDGSGTCDVNSTDHADCSACEKCVAGACDNQLDTEDLKGNCALIDCTAYIYGWSGNSCRRYANSTGSNGLCAGDGTCQPVSASCSGVGTQTAACDGGCKKACPAGGAVTSYNSVFEVCYDDGLRHSCPSLFVCISGICTDFTCPYLYTWDGTTAAFETDVIGQGKLGVASANGYLEPNPNDAYVLEVRPVARDGYYDVRLVEEQAEVTYLDAVQLYALDLPAGRMAVTERSAFGAVFPGVEGITHTVDANLTPPPAVTDLTTGEDIRAVLAASDGNFVSLNDDPNIGFDYRTVELDLGNLSAAPQIKLLLDAITSFPYTPEGLARKAQFGPRTLIEVIDASGTWVRVPSSVVPLAPPPAAHRLIALDLTQAFVSNDYRVRLTFLFQTFIDAIYLDVTADDVIALQPLAPGAAELRYHGFSERVEGLFGNELIYDESTSITPDYFPGYYTRYGDVSPLTEQVDDMFVIYYGGEEVVVTFAAPPEPPAGTVREIVIYAHGYYKGTNASVPLTVEPLPFSAMSSYPYDPQVEGYPTDAEHLDYLSTWNTRLEGP